MIFKTFYLAAFLISFVCLVLQLSLGRNRHSNIFPMVFVSIMVANLGYLSAALSTTTEEALLAVKITYLGECYLQYFIFRAIADLCNVKIPRVLSAVLFTISTLVFISTLSIGFSTAYYKSVEIFTGWGVTCLKKEYGPLHVLYLAMLLVEVIMQIFLVIKSFFMGKSVSYKTSISILSLEVISLAVYAAEEVFDIPADIIPFSYCVSEIIFLCLLYRFDKYSISENIQAHINLSETVGFISFDKKMNFVGCNDAAKKFIPELELCKIDYSIPDAFESLNELLVKPLSLMYSSGQKEKTFELEYNQRSLKCSATQLFKFNHPYGVTVKFEDDTDQQKYVQLLNNYNQELLVSVTEKTGKILDLQKKMIYSVAEIIEERDEITGGHIKRTSEGVRILAQEMEHYPDEYFVPENFYELTVQAAPLHDLGKIVVDDAILRKKGRLTDEEFTIIKMHPLKGAEIVEKVLRGIEEDDFVDTAKNIALYHHERWDGKGYPVGLAGEQIPLEARMMALADVTDALLSKRSYKDAMSYDQTFQIIQDGLGTQFDPELGKLFLDCRDKIVAFYESVKQPEFN